MYQGRKAALGVRSFATKDAVLSIKDGRIPYHIFSARTPAETPPQPAYLDFGTLKPANEKQFLAAIVPAKTSEEANALIGKMFRVTGENLSGIRVERGSEMDLVLFRTAPENMLMRNGDWSANASVLTVTHKGTDLQMLAAQNARSVTNGKRLMFSAETPASIAVNYSSDYIDAVSTSKTGTKIMLFAGTKPIRILLDNKVEDVGSSRFSAADGTLTFNIPAGRHEIRIVLK